MSIKIILSISRPKFWMYLAGTYLVGLSFGMQNITHLNNVYFLIHFLYFLIPANIFLYGINDYFDEDTDKYNDKKGTHEHKLLSKEKTQLIGFLLITVAISFFILAVQTSLEIQIWLTFFLFLSYFYSAPPLRFKAHPLIDFSSNFLYGIPGIVGYYHASGTFPPALIIIAIFTWTSSMHLFSAIPDITPDKKAHLKTTAVLFGKTASLILCLILWSATAFISFLYIPSYLSIISLVYPLIPFLILIDKRMNIKKVYWYFPIINTAVGFLLFLLAILL